MSELTPWSASLGGLMIGTASALAVVQGKIPGISGVFGRIFRGVSGDTGWRVAFVLGLVAGGAATYALLPSTAAFGLPRTLPQVAIAGLLVGLGTRVGGGCTSGHGVCGVGSGSIRGIVGTLTFMATGFATVYALHHLLGGAP